MPEKTDRNKRRLKNPKHWKPCGEGENICNCKKASECGYIAFYKAIARLDYKLIFSADKNKT